MSLLSGSLAYTCFVSIQTSAPRAESYPLTIYRFIALNTHCRRQRKQRFVHQCSHMVAHSAGYVFVSPLARVVWSCTYLMISQEYVPIGRSWWGTIIGSFIFRDDINALVVACRFVMLPDGKTARVCPTYVQTIVSPAVGHPRLLTSGE